MKTILIICGLVLRFLFAFDQHLYFPIVLLLFRHLFLKAYLCVFCSICYLQLYLLIVPLLLFPYFLLHSFQAFLVPTYFFSRLCQGTTGPEGQSTTRPQDQNHRTRGPQDQRNTGRSTTGPQDQRTTGPEDHGPEDHRTRGHSTTGPQDQRTTGPEDHRTTGPEEPKFLFQGL